MLFLLLVPTGMERERERVGGEREGWRVRGCVVGVRGCCTALVLLFLLLVPRGINVGRGGGRASTGVTMD